MDADEFTHEPVFLSSEGDSPIFNILNPREGETVLDVTVGLGGHALAFAERIGPTGTLIALDADRKNLDRAEERLRSMPPTKRFLHENFFNLRERGLPKVDILFADLGVSSPHVDDPERGFSFRFESPLDLRFDQSKGRTASDLLGRWKEDEIKDVLFQYGEIRNPGRLGRSLFELGRICPPRMLTTTDVKQRVEKIFGYRAPSILPQVFQALRIAVNKELDALEALLAAGPEMLKLGGRLGIISYHSLEDRLVKQAIKRLSTPIKDLEKGSIVQEASFEVLTPKAVKPTPEEIARNPRARSARFRVLRRR